MSTLDKAIFFLGGTFSGHTHDYTMLKEEFPPGKAWFQFMKVLADLGYQGIVSDYSGENIRIPHKKPRKSKKNPIISLSDKQKEENQVLSKIRILVENAICGLKRYNILVHRFRNHRNNFDDDVVGIAAGLWNFNLRY
ncbi:DDE superfamily endonuclease [Candidatus Electrothrix aarhusensis]|uniref:DDE superfamily endonuclease n=1 Tax=Candidatus Electrothrix aarhusensis TaxID=1859131 RepID=A0A444IUI4_9BACT|nr:DDE superfamily endonuclease [Candidatus Electrothrix aarhusensis]